MIDCRIVGLNQAMDFETNTSSTALVLELPSGRRLQVTTDDTALEEIIQLQVAARGVPKPARRVPAPAPPPPSSEFVQVGTGESATQEFGGGYDPASEPIGADDYAQPPMPAAPEVAVPEEEEEDEEEEPPPPRMETPKAAKKRIRKNGSVPTRSVPKNDHGYPIVTGGPDPDTLTGGIGQDEDGIASV